MMSNYEKAIVKAWSDLCELNGGASPHEVCERLSKQGELAPMDTVIDVADQMRELRDRGYL